MRLDGRSISSHPISSKSEAMNRYGPAAERPKDVSIGDKSPAEHFRSIPETLNLLRENGVVCPNQTMRGICSEDFGSLAWSFPNEWKQKCEVQYPPNQRKRNSGIIIFKRGGSGSTWLGTLLDTAHPDIDFRHEAHRTVFKKTDAPQVAERKLINFLNGGECLEVSYCGFSISPSKWAAGVDWTKIVRETGANIVVFIRTNVIKRSIGLQKKERIRKLPSWCRVRLKPMILFFSLPPISEEYPLTCCLFLAFVER